MSIKSVILKNKIFRSMEVVIWAPKILAMVMVPHYALAWPLNWKIPCQNCNVHYVVSLVLVPRKFKNMLTGNDDAIYMLITPTIWWLFRRHFDLTSPSVSKEKEEIFSCPLCVKNFKLSSDLELHVNIEHRDILSPASPPTKSCPVCGMNLDGEDNVSKFCLHFFRSISS